MRTCLPRAWVLLAGLASLAAATPLGAETVRLRSGVAYDATSIELQGDALRLGLRLGAGGGRATFPLASIHPADLARILEMRTPASDAAGQLRLARVALEAGRFALTLRAAERAATSDAALTQEALALVLEVRAVPARQALVEIELDLRLGRPLAARERARALLELGVPSVPPATEAAKARMLLSLADSALAGPAWAPLPKDAPAPGPLAPAPPGPPAAGSPPPSPALADAATLQERALLTREQAADPGLSAPQRETLLSAAALDLLDARRLLLALPTTVAPDLVARLDRLRALLVSTWLDLADLARGAGRPDVALDRAQAALVLEPESERAWEVRRWIEGDLSMPPAWAEGPPVSFSGGWFVGGGSSPGGFGAGPTWGGGGGAGCGPYAWAFHAHGHVHGHGPGHGHRHGGGAAHNPGQRR